MKKYLLACAVALPLGAVSGWATPYGDFLSRATSAALKPFALDLGGVLGGAAFHSARTLGLPGFDAGVTATVQTKPDRDNVILNASGVKQFGIPMIQAEVGLPLHIDVIVHGISGQGAGIFGGGLRYGIHKSGLLSVLPDIAVSAFADKVNHTYFSATHYSMNAMASFHLPILHPYVGVGFDSTKVKVGAATTAGLVGTSASAQGSRLTAGVDFSFMPFVHAYGAYTLLHGISGADLGLGVRF